MASTRTTTWVLKASPGSRRHDVRLAQGIHHASCSTTTDGPLFGQPHLSGTGGHPPRSPTPPEGATTKRRKRDAQAGVPLAGWPRAQLAFKDSMVHGILQFTPSIAFRYVLHRCESRDIRCRESFVLTEQRASPRTIRERGARGRAVDCSIPWRFPRRGSLVARRACAPRATGGGARRASAAPGV